MFWFDVLKAGPVSIFVYKASGLSPFIWSIPHHNHYSLVNPRFAGERGVHDDIKEESRRGDTYA